MTNDDECLLINGGTSESKHLHDAQAELGYNVSE